MACKAALVLARSFIMVTRIVVILIMITLTSTPLIVFRHSLRTGTNTSTRIIMSINTRAREYELLYWDE